MKLKNNPKVSIVAISHNHSKYIIETLNSIKNQTYPTIELIIINNLKDESEALINNWIEENKDFDVQFIQNDIPVLLLENSNKGLARVTGDYYQLLSCDDILLPHKIESQLEIFENNAISCVFSEVQLIDENSNPLNNSNLYQNYNDLQERILSDETITSKLSRGSYLKAPTVLLKTKDVKTLGGYDEKYYMEDYPLWLKLASKGHRFYYQNSKTVQYRVLPASHSRVRHLEIIKSKLKLRLDFSDFLYKNKNNKKNFYKTCYGFVRSGYTMSSQEIKAIRAKINPSILFYVRLSIEIMYLQLKKRLKSH